MRVTEALTILGFIDVQWLTQEAADRGTFIHKITDLDDKDDLVEERWSEDDRVDQVLHAKLEGWRKFKREKRPNILKREFKVDYDPLGMTGTADALLEIDGHMWIVDIKSGARVWWHRWQVALYALLYSLKTGQPAPRRGVVYLLENDYRWDQFDDRRDVERAKALITTAHIKKEAA